MSPISTSTPISLTGAISVTGPGAVPSGDFAGVLATLSLGGPMPAALLPAAAARQAAAETGKDLPEGVEAYEAAVDDELDTVGERAADDHAAPAIFMPIPTGRALSRSHAEPRSPADEQAVRAEDVPVEIALKASLSAEGDAPVKAASDHREKSADTGDNDPQADTSKSAIAAAIVAPLLHPADIRAEQPSAALGAKATAVDPVTEATAGKGSAPIVDGAARANPTGGSGRDRERVSAQPDSEPSIPASPNVETTKTQAVVAEVSPRRTTADAASPARRSDPAATIPPRSDRADRSPGSADPQIAVANRASSRAVSEPSNPAAAHAMPNDAQYRQAADAVRHLRASTASNQDTGTVSQPRAEVHPEPARASAQSPGQPAQPTVSAPQPRVDTGLVQAATMTVARNPERMFRIAASRDGRDGDRADSAITGIGHLGGASGVAGGSSFPPVSAMSPVDLRQDPGLQQMIDRIESLRTSDDGSQAKIRLAPDALGTVDISVKRDGDRLHVHFTAPEAAARSAIADAAPRLTELADARGVRLGQTTVDAGTSGHGQQPGQGAPQPQAKHNRLAREDAPHTDIRDHRIA